MTDEQLLAELCIEWFSNNNQAGEYDGTDPRLRYPNHDAILHLARKIKDAHDRPVQGR